MNNLIPIDDLKKLSALSEQYDPMLEVIQKHRPGALQLTSHLRGHTQFQSVMLDNTAPLGGLTLLRSLRQCLSDINSTESAIEENTHKNLESLEKAKHFRQRALTANGTADLLNIKAAQLESQVRRGEFHYAAAVRKLAGLYEKYADLTEKAKAKLGKDTITEADIEAEEPEFHIIQAFSQALCAARSSHNGQIDNGNFIYFQNLGINGQMAQCDVLGFFHNEQKVIQDFAQRGESLDPVEMNNSEVRFLRRMFDKYKDCPAAFAVERGLQPEMSKIATLGYTDASI